MPRPAARRRSRRSAFGRIAHYPPGFMFAHPLRALRNAVGNHPSALADRYLGQLRGIEIGGAAHNDFFLDTTNVDHTLTPSTTPAQIRYAGRVMNVDVIAAADALPFAEDAYDFVLASHVIEHLPDPIATLIEWRRVARRHLFIIVPLRGNVYDRERPLTPLAELIDRHARGFASDEERHWTVWSPETFCELCRHLEMRVVEVQDPDDKRETGFTVVVEL